MALNEGRDYLYLIWKCGKTRRQYMVGRLGRNGQYEFQYDGEVDEARKAGFAPLISFENLNVIYKSDELFPAFPRRLPDRKRKDIDRILDKYGLEEYDVYQRLKRSGAKLPIDNLYFIDPILNFKSKVKKVFYLAGADTTSDAGRGEKISCRIKPSVLLTANAASQSRKAFVT